jgi:hypothetical protein
MGSRSRFALMRYLTALFKINATPYDDTMEQGRKNKKPATVIH